MLEVVLEFGDELRVALGSLIGLFQFFERGDEGFGNKDAAIGAEMAKGVG
jgi:hypothetical protein